ncbi:MAG: S8 family serine peptidase, partial [bacterium]
MPEAWNLYDYAIRQGSSLDVGVLEANEAPGGNTADSTNPDLSPRVNVSPGAMASNHATMVAGFIGAIWNNNTGVEGVYPRNLTIVSRPLGFAGTLQASVVAALSQPPPLNVRILNYSAQVNYTSDPVVTLVKPAAPPGPMNPTLRGQMDINANQFLTTIRNWETGPTGRSMFLMFCAAGNERLRPGTALDMQARDKNECNNVADRWSTSNPALPVLGGDHFFGVEAMDSAGNRSTFSTSAGTVSAPGTCVRSTEFNDGANYDACPNGSDATNQNYATQSGTSFASPITAGLALYVWSLDSTLTYQQVRQILASTANRVLVAAGPLGGASGSERIDGFSAVTGIDLVRGNMNIQKALVDVDDGTEDGNLRARTFPTDPDTDTILSPDNRRGDGIINMSDFRAWRDAYLQFRQADFAAAGLSVSLNGPATHFKMDFNFDGCVGTQAAAPAHPVDVPVPPAGCANAPNEQVGSRYDFNGDGELRATRVAPFKIDPDTQCNSLNNPPGCLRDLDVLADKDIWQGDVPVFGLLEGVEADPAQEGMVSSGDGEWTPQRYLLGERDQTLPSVNQILQGLPDYIHSADLHIQLDWSRISNDYEKVHITVSSEIVSDFSQTFDREVKVPYNSQPLELTIPIWTGRAKVT